MLISSLTKKPYDEKDAIVVLNMKQSSFYWGKKGIQPLSIYPSNDRKTGEPIIVFVFSKSKTREAYQEWLAMRPTTSEVESND